MINYLQELQNSWSCPIKGLANTSSDWQNTPHWRLLKALNDNNYRGKDLMVLFRSVIQYEKINNSKLASLKIPKNLCTSILQEEYKLASLDVRQTSSANTCIRSFEWYPQWLPHANKESLESRLFIDENCHSKTECAGDPFLKFLNFQRYRSNAQREAVRSVLCAPPGQTLVLILPTGSGKSVCAFIPAILYPSVESELMGVTPIVVPTISLALDLAAKIENIVGHRVAYRPEERENALGIRMRCESGTQGPLIVSPEVFVGSLFSTLLKSAKNGHIRHVVVDEAHMILNWGDEFRPSFQQMSSARRKLLSQTKTPFVTVLMSATLTQYHLESLEKMFSENENLTIVHATRLRPEPIYWQAQAPTKKQRIDWILEAIHHLPRPLILYTTLKSSCIEWNNIIINNGFQRVSMIHGDITPREYQKQLQRWKENDVDIIIATSAFGLGVDKADVRVVIHAELPESLDRFYQDVGRGGRNGNPCLSLLIWTLDDWEIVDSLSAPTFIGGEKGRKRWNAMFNSKKVVDKAESIYCVSLNSAPELDMKSEQNRLWNLRTLLLMDRAEIINIEHPTKENTRNFANVRLSTLGHTQLKLWDERIVPFRNDLNQHYAKQKELLAKMLNFDMSCCISSLFEECYKSNRYQIPIVRACGGCFHCREKSQRPFCGKILPRRTPKITFSQKTVGKDLQKLLKTDKLGCVYYPSTIKGDKLLNAIQDLVLWLIDQGVKNIVSFENLEKRLWKTPYNDRSRLFFLHQDVPCDITKNQPTVFVLDQSPTTWWPKTWEIIQDSLPTTTILIIPINTQAPDHPNRYVYDVLPCPSIQLQSWEEEYLE
ncbi:ATP-dependent DNA helicase RecQ [Candidatus Uabimicrobium amorphum]|uniref:ATP-dependent DNA helicase RecQ n=1 Tax=Uabimicrobium amorphum TaxID=2596890 RepID=A0A5S9F703_UABAM|nr:ATP-dependent DNA helicase RecQ [Candidatus Uabimicrobium amorphum]